MKASIVVPLYNEEGLDEFHRRLRSVIDALPHAFEVWYVNDGSTDRSEAVVHNIIRQDHRVRLLNLTRNFGKEAALAAGLDFADGDVVITMDGDGQHPPHLISDMISLYQQGFDLVSTQRSERPGGLRGAASWLFYRLVNLVSAVPVLPQSTDFQLLSREVVLDLRQMREARRFLRGLLSWAGFRFAVISFTPLPRIAGASRYALPELTQQAYNAFLSCGTRPGCLSLVGLGVLAMGCLGSAVLALSMTTGEAALLTPGWIVLIVGVWLLGSAQLIALLIVGQYVALIYEQVRRRPLYLLRGKPVDHETLTGERV